MTADSRDQRRPVTLYDVAAEAGVSHTTVSRVVRGERGMTPQTRRLVAETVARLKYRPNSPARVLAEMSRPAGDPPVVLDWIAPIVAIVPDAAGGGAPTEMDSSAEAEAAIDHLRSIGHRAIRRVWSSAREGALGSPHVRGSTHTETAPQTALTADDGYRVGRDAALLLGCSAVVVPTASFALGLIRGLNERGIRVPVGLSVVSLEDTADSAHFLPPLTTVASTPVGRVVQVRASTSPPQGAGVEIACVIDHSALREGP